MAMLKDKLGGLVGRHPYDDWLQKEPPVRIVVPIGLKEKEETQK